MTSRLIEIIVCCWLEPLIEQPMYVHVRLSFPVILSVNGEFINEGLTNTTNTVWLEHARGYLLIMVMWFYHRSRIRRLSRHWHKPPPANQQQQLPGRRQRRRHWRTSWRRRRQQQQHPIIAEFRCLDADDVTVAAAPEAEQQSRVEQQRLGAGWQHPFT